MQFENIKNEQIIYHKESEYIFSAVKYKFGRQISHKYYFYPDGKLAEVEMKLPTAFRFFGAEKSIGYDVAVANYNREDFHCISFLWNLLWAFMFTITVIGAIVGIPLDIYTLYIAMHHIYWHNKTYKFSKEEQTFINISLK
jgi:hypothetical protein